MKLKTIALLGLMPLIMSACISATTHYTTGNPIGTKEGYVASKIAGNFDSGIGAAAKKGGITKIGSVDIYYYGNPMAPYKIGVKVTGE